MKYINKAKIKSTNEEYDIHDSRIGDDINGVVPDTRTIAGLQLNKDISTSQLIDKISEDTGKGLSTNDFTDSDKNNLDLNTAARHTHSNKAILDNTTASFTTQQATKLNGIQAGAQVNVLEGVSVNGVNLPISEKTVNIDLIEYAKTTYVNGFAKTLTATIDPQTYIITLSLKDRNNNIISTQSVDLPLETMVVDGSYDDNTKSLILTLKNGQLIIIPVSSLISGLVTSTDLQTVLQNYYTIAQANSAISSAISTALASYSTTAQTNSMISTAISTNNKNYLTKDKIASTYETKIQIWEPYPNLD